MICKYKWTSWFVRHLKRQNWLTWNPAITDKRQNSSAEPEDIRRFVVACVKTSLTFQPQTNQRKHQKQQADRTVTAVRGNSRCVLCIWSRSLCDFLWTTWQWNRSQTAPFFSVDIKWINHEIMNEANKIWWISVRWRGFALRKGCWVLLKRLTLC